MLLLRVAVYDSVSAGTGGVRVVCLAEAPLLCPSAFFVWCYKKFQHLELRHLFRWPPRASPLVVRWCRPVGGLLYRRGGCRICRSGVDEYVAPQRLLLAAHGCLLVDGVDVLPAVWFGGRFQDQLTGCWTEVHCWLLYVQFSY